MRRILFSGLLATAFLLEAHAGGSGRVKKAPILQPVKTVSNAVRLMLAAKKEAAMSTAQMSAPVAPVSNKKGSKGSNTLSTSALSFTDLGSSINPFGSYLNGRNIIAADPTLNTVALFRRGWQTDPNFHGGNNGNKLFFDVSKDGGATWTLGQGPLYQHTIYDTSVNNFGARYPQGVIWNPAGNTNPDEALAFGNPRVLDGTNDAWGGLAKGWKKINPAAGPTTAKQTLWQSPDPLHFRTVTMEVTSTGNVFLVEPEEDLSSGGVVFTDKVMVYKYTYNSTTNNFDSTVINIPFSNEGGDYGTAISDAAIAFAPDGLQGYIALSAWNNNYDSLVTYAPFISKTTDGGVNWSPFVEVPINFRHTNYTSPDMDALRDSLFVGNYVRFTETEVVRASRGEDYAHKVDYMVLDLDLTVDAHGYGHLLTNLCVAGYGDTLSLNEVPTAGFQWIPGYGSWNIDLIVNQQNDTASAIYLGHSPNFRACYGDCEGTENLEERNRPQVARSLDGSTIAFVWYETDEEAHPQVGDYTNSNPDMWVQRMKVTGPKSFRMNDAPKNMTKGSDFDGLIAQGSVAPFMLNSPTGYTIAASGTSIPGIPPGGTTAVWPTKHFYINQLNVPVALDSFPVVPPLFQRVTGVSPLVAKNSQFNLNIVPNPSAGVFYACFSTEKASQANMRLVNSLGQVVLEKSQNLGQGDFKLPFNISNLKSGIYFFSAEVNGKLVSKRIVKN